MPRHPTTTNRPAPPHSTALEHDGPTVATPDHDNTLPSPTGKGSQGHRVKPQATAGSRPHDPTSDPTAATAAPVPGSCPRASGVRVALAGPTRSGRPEWAEQERIRLGVGARLVDGRGRRGLTQRQLADLAGCARSTVERLEVGRIRPTTALLRALAHALAVPPGFTPSPERLAAVEALWATLAGLAGPSLVQSTPEGQRRRERALRRSRRAVNAAVLPAMRAARGVAP